MKTTPTQGKPTQPTQMSDHAFNVATAITLALIIRGLAHGLIAGPSMSERATDIVQTSLGAALFPALLFLLLSGSNRTTLASGAALVLLSGALGIVIP